MPVIKGALLLVCCAQLSGFRDCWAATDYTRKPSRRQSSSRCLTRANRTIYVASSVERDDRNARALYRYTEETLTVCQKQHITLLVHWNVVPKLHTNSILQASRDHGKHIIPAVPSVAYICMDMPTTVFCSLASVSSGLALRAHESLATRMRVRENFPHRHAKSFPCFSCSPP